MTPFASPDQQLQKMHQRAQMRMIQAFQLFMIQIAHGAKPKEAIDRIDESMDAWAEYQDRYEDQNRLPDLPDMTGFMMEKFSEVMEHMKGNTDRIAEHNIGSDEPMTPEEICEAEQLAWDEYQTSKRILSTIAPDAVDRGTFERMTSDAERHWRSFGTASLRLQLAAAQSQTTDPSSPVNGGLPK